MRKAIMISVSAAAVLAASQPVFAKDFRPVTKQSAATQLHVSPATQLHVTPPQQNNNKPAGGATGAVNKPSGGLSGLGVPGHLGGTSVGSDILKGSGTKTSIMPSGKSDGVKDQVGTANGSRGGAVGVQKQDGVSAGMAGALRTGAQNAKASAGGAAAGVQKSDGASARYSSEMQRAISNIKGTQGQAQGVQGGDGGVKLSDTQLKAIKDMRVNPVVNPPLANDDKDEANKVLKPLLDKAKKDAAWAAKPSPFLEAMKKLVEKPPKPPKQ